MEPVSLASTFPGSRLRTSAGATVPRQAGKSFTDSAPWANYLRKASSGDLVAFNAIVREMESLVFAVCLRVTSDRAMAEDAAQETFISAWRHIDQARAETFRPWLIRIAVNASRSQLRKQRRRGEVTLEAAATYESPDAGPEAEALRQEQSENIADALARLPIAQREVIVLWHQVGLRYEEIARVTQVAPGTVKSRLFRARRQLSELLSSR